MEKMWAKSGAGKDRKKEHRPVDARARVYRRGRARFCRAGDTVGGGAMLAGLRKTRRGAGTETNGKETDEKRVKNERVSAVDRNKMRVRT